MRTGRASRPIPQAGDEISCWDCWYRVEAVDQSTETLNIRPILGANAEAITPDEDMIHTIPFSKLIHYTFAPSSP
jgi:hypothetical protein